MEVKQSTQFDALVKMTLAATGAGKTGLVYTDVTVYLQKQGGSSAVKTLSSGAEWVEVDATNMPGVYRLRFSAANNDTLGFNAFSVAANLCTTFIGVIEIVANLEADTYARVGSPVALDGGSATIAGMLDKMAGTGFVESTDALHNIGTSVALGTPTNNTAGAPTLTTGTLISGTYTNTYVADGSALVYAPVTPAVDGFGLNVDLPFAVPDGQAVSTLTIRGFFNAGASRNCNVYAYNWTTLAWDQLSDSVSRMNNATVNQTYTFALLPAHLESGLVQIAFRSASTTTGDRLHLDQILVTSISAGATAADIADAVYDRMALSIYNGKVCVDTVNGVAGTDLGVHGLKSNPVSTLADAITLATALGVKHLCFEPDSSITLTQSMAGWRFEGDVAINLNGQAIEHAHFDHCTLSGVGTGAGAHYVDCDFGTVTVGPCDIHEGNFMGTMTLASAGDYTFHHCVSGIPGTSTPILIFAAAAYVGFRSYSGGIEIRSMTATERLSLEGNGQLVIHSGCTGGAIAVRGAFTLVDNVVGGFTGTLSQGARTAEDNLKKWLLTAAKFLALK